MIGLLVRAFLALGHFAFAKRIVKEIILIGPARFRRDYCVQLLGSLLAWMECAVRLHTVKSWVLLSAELLAQGSTLIGRLVSFISQVA
jgi:hypothetical protein